MSITDDTHICIRCMEHKTGCMLCGVGGADVQRTPAWLTEKYREEAREERERAYARRYYG